MKMNTFLAAMTILVVVFAAYTLDSVDAEQQTLKPGKLNACMNLVQICANCTYVNITAITAGDNNTFYLGPGQFSMTQLTPSLFNLTFCNTSTLGEYVVQNLADPNGAKKISNFNFFITKSGELREINPFIPLVAIIFFGAVAFVIAIFVPIPVARFFLFGMAILAAYIGVQYTLTVIQGYALVDDLSTNNYLIVLFRIFSWIISGLVTLTIVYLIYGLRKLGEIRKGFVD